jgi:hypothetical protein
METRCKPQHGTTVRLLIIALLAKREVAGEAVLKCGKVQSMSEDYNNKFQDNSVGTATNYGVDGPASNFDRDIFFSAVSRRAPGSSGYRGLIVWG